MTVQKVKHYSISNSTFVIQGKVIDGKLSAYVFDKNGFTLVNVRPNVLIGQAFRKINSSTTHAREVSKSILGESTKKLPFVVTNHFGEPVVFFPLYSPSCKDNIWINYNAITNIDGRKGPITLTFHHRFEIELNERRQTINNQYVNAANLYKNISQHWK